jgi:type VI secretion system secreted protein Hcp
MLDGIDETFSSLRLPARAAVDYFLQIDGIPGESTDAGHPNTIEVWSFSFGVKNPPTFTAGAGSAAGKATFSEISFTKKVDRSSPLFYLHCVQGKRIPKAILYGATRGEGGDDVYTITLEDVLVSSIQTGAASDGGADESLALNFTKFHVSYRQQLPDGSLGDPVRFGWDLVANGPYSPRP